MIRCNKCKKITHINKPTGLLYRYRFWSDKDGLHKDIKNSEIVCMECLKKFGDDNKNDE